MQHTIARMGPFAGKQQVGATPIKRGTPLNELFNDGWPFFNQRPNCFEIAKAISRHQRVLLMQFYFVVIAQGGRDSALRVFGRGFSQTVFGNDENTPFGGKFNGSPKTGYACSYYYKIRLEPLNRGGQKHMVQRDQMPAFEVETPHHTYSNHVERGILSRVASFIPARAGKLFAVSTEDVWKLHGSVLAEQFPPDQLNVLYFPGGESNKRLNAVEHLADQMLARHADRSSVVLGFGGGIVTDISGFLAAIFMRGIPVVQIPTTLLAQVDAATGGKTGVNLAGGKNLIGSFHQPLAVLIDPDVLSTLPEREYRAGLFEVIKCGVIRDSALFRKLAQYPDKVLSMNPALVDELIAAAVRIKAEVVSADEREGDLRRILNFGHTIGHALEAETDYRRFLHGEAIAWGMLAATRLASLLGKLPATDAAEIERTVCRYGPLPPAGDLNPDSLLDRLNSDKKTIQGKVHFVLPTKIGAVEIVSEIKPAVIRQAMMDSLQ
jgi:3-dehydroquinate synthase